MEDAPSGSAESQYLPPGTQYPEGKEIEKEYIDVSDARAQIEILRRIHLQPWQLAEVIKTIQREAGAEPDEFPGVKYPEEGKPKRKVSWDPELGEEAKDQQEEPNKLFDDEQQ